MMYKGKLLSQFAISVDHMRICRKCSGTSSRFISYCSTMVQLDIHVSYAVVCTRYRLLCPNIFDRICRPKSSASDRYAISYFSIALFDLGCCALPRSPYPSFVLCSLFATLVPCQPYLLETANAVFSENTTCPPIGYIRAARYPRRVSPCGWYMAERMQNLCLFALLYSRLSFELCGRSAVFHSSSPHNRWLYISSAYGTGGNVVFRHPGRLAVWQYDLR